MAKRKKGQFEATLTTDEIGVEFLRRAVDAYDAKGVGASWLKRFFLDMLTIPDEVKNHKCTEYTKKGKEVFKWLKPMK